MLCWQNILWRNAKKRLLGPLRMKIICAPVS